MKQPKLHFFKEKKNEIWNIIEKILKKENSIKNEKKKIIKIKYKKNYKYFVINIFNKDFYKNKNKIKNYKKYL